MEFVKDDAADARQLGIRLDHAGEDAFGDDFDAGGGGRFAVTAHTVADCLACGFAQCLGHAFSGSARGEAAGFEHQDFAVDQVLLEQEQGHAGGFTCTWGGLEDGHFGGAQSIAEGGQGCLNREVAHDASLSFGAQAAESGFGREGRKAIGVCIDAGVHHGEGKVDPFLHVLGRKSCDAGVGACAGGAVTF